MVKFRGPSLLREGPRVSLAVFNYALQLLRLVVVVALPERLARL